ncbi:uncharacterized protein LOC103519880 [Diaphorina citri]|uniref:Uncharacterized protein LOC103519880 n=1 Tax=Diaphorina citri TaxID=121845 RepID=A0A3Q0JIQ2_DIACI|nr:uncharacterized protein LOC103519880 [Diaphorina citri]
MTKENVRLPIFIKKILADQNIYVTSKNKFEVGNSSKQTEFPAADDYLMSVENDPNIINKQPPVNETPNDSDHNGNTSNDESNDPVWIPDASPKTSNRNRRRDKKNKVEKGKSLNVTKKTVSQTEPKCYQDPFDKLLSEQNEQKKENDDVMSVENDPNIINKQPPANETPNDSDHNGNTMWIPDASPKTSNRNRRRDKKNKVEKEKSLNVTKKTVSQTEPKCYEDPFDKLLSEQNEQKKENDGQKEIEEKIDQKKVKEISQTPLSDTEKEENEDLFIVNRVERNKRKISINLDSESSSTATECGKECDKFDEENSNEESSNEPSSTQLRCVSKTYPNKTKNISDVHIHEKSAASIFDFDEYVEESCKATLLNKYALLRNRKRMKPKDDIGDNEDKEEDELELFKDSKKTDTKVSSRKRIKQTDSKTVDIDKTEISKDNEQQSKRTRKQLGVNKNTSEIENLIRSKKLKVDKDIENEDGSTEKKEIPIDGLNPKEIDKILNEDKQLNVVPRSTRQRKNSKIEDTVKAESTKHEPSVKNPPRQVRTKTLSETSTDTNVMDTNKNTNGETNEAAKTKRTTRATPRSVNKNAKTTESNIEPTKSTEPVSSEEKSITPIRKPGKRLLKPTSIPEDNSATSTSTGEYLTPLSNTPGDVATPREGLDEGLTTPKSRHAFKVPDNNATPVAKTKKETTKKNAVKTPSTLADAKKDTATLKTPSAVATGKKDTVVKTPVTPATVKRNPLLNAMYKRNVKGETPLHMACKKDTNKVLSLLKNNMNPNVKDNAGWTPLHDAVSIGNESVVRLLLEAGGLGSPGQLKNLPKQAHHCINCLSVYCYMCVHKNEVCPKCHAKYCDKSYLKYYELGDANVEFIYSMVNQLHCLAYSTACKSTSPSHGLHPPTVDIDKTEISKDNEQQSKRTRKQLGVNKNTSEIENLIRSKKLKVDKDIENEDGSTEKKEIPIDGLNPKEIDKILNEDKQLNVVPRSTRQRKNSKNEDTVKAESTKHEPSVKNPPRQARTKTLSETSTDTNVKDTNKNTNGETNEAAKTKRTTRATPRSVNKNAKTTESNIEPTKSIEPVSSEEKSITPIRKPGKRLLKPTSIPEDNSATSTSTGEYLTPLSNTPGDVATPREGLDEGLTTPKSRHAFKVPDNNATPVAKTKKETTKKNAVKTPSTLADAKKDTATLKTPSTGKKDTVVKTPVTPATVKRNPLLNAMYKRNVKGETPLHMACKKDTNKVLSLLKNNMNPNVKDNAGWTPLHDAVSIGNESVVRLLLEAGALVNVPGLDNDTPLHLAARDVRPALAKLLIQYGADVDKRNIQGHKPLEYLDVIGRDDIKTDILTALSLPRLSAAPPPSLPNCIDIVIYADQLDKTQTSGLAQFVKTLSSGADVPIIVSTLLQSNVNILLVNGTPERTCIATCNVLRAILSGIKAVDYTWISRSLEIGKVLPVEEFEILGTVDYPLAKPFHRSRENKENLLPGLFNGLQVYLTKPWPTSSPLSSEDMRDIFKRGGATLLNREPDPESMNLSESSVMYHVNRPQHRLYNLSQAIVYSEEALPRRLYNMEHVKALGLSWVRACVEQFEIVQPKSPYEQ